MEVFEERPASKPSVVHSKLVCGMGTNDAIYKVYTTVAYRAFKANYITQVANEQVDYRLKEALLAHANLYL